MKVGRYRIVFGRYFWIQTRLSMTVRRFLCFTILKEVHLDEIDKKQEFPIGTGVKYKGRKYFYCKAGAEKIEGAVVTGEIKGETKG